MTRGFQPDEIAEHAAAMELAAAVAAWRAAETTAKEVAQRALDAGCRAVVVGEALDMERSTFYRWMAKHPSPAPQPRGKRQTYS
jgi:transcriptional regulator of acetoin/glycerol metabolism